MISVEEILPTTHKILEKIRDVRNGVAQSTRISEACFRNVVKPLIDVENETDGDIKVLAMLRYVSPNQKAREASEEAVKLMGECHSEFTVREDLYLLIKAVKDRGEALSPEAAKYLDNLVKDFRRCGHGVLSQLEIERYLAIRNQIDVLRRAFSRNIREEDSGIWFAQEDLAGVPGDALARFEHRTVIGKGEMRYVHLRDAESDIILKYATKSSTREKMYSAWAHQLPQNIDLLKRIIKLRDQNARLLGYSSHTSFRIEKRIAKSVEWVLDLFEGLEKALLPKGKQEVEHLLAQKKAHLAESGADSETNPDTITPWDMAFYSRIALENIAVDHAKISEFFPLPHAIRAMLDVFASCLQLKFVPAASELVSGSIWHEDVEMWCVWDERETHKGEFVGYLYMDLLWRPGKYKGSQNVNLQRVSVNKGFSGSHYKLTLKSFSFSQGLPEG